MQLDEFKKITQAHKENGNYHGGQQKNWTIVNQ